MGEWADFVDSFNWFEVRHIFQRWPGFPDVIEDAEDLLAEAIVEIWSSVLATRYPEREFAVFVDYPVGDGACVVVKQTAPALSAPKGWCRPALPSTPA